MSRVLVDATAVPSDQGGVGRYVDGLVAALAAAGADFAVVCQRAGEAHYSRVAPSATVVTAPAAVSHRPARLAWEQTRLPLVAEQVGAQVVHSPYYTMPLRLDRPVVVTLHDATWFSDPDLHSSVKGTFFRSATRVSLRRATRCLVPSEATRDELVRLVDADPAAIDVVRHGVDPSVFHPPAVEESERVQVRLGLEGRPYVAFLSTHDPRKNVPALVRGWVRACAGREDPPVLVLAGGAGADEAVDAAVAEVPAPLRVLRPGHLASRDLPGFFGGALLTVHPALAEGFGLTVLEAMACGSPVLVNRTPALAELGGDAVAYTRPDEASIEADLGALLDDADRRAALSAAGLARARELTWAASAEQHLRAYAAALAP